MDEKTPAQAGDTTAFDLQEWLSSLLFSHPGGVQSASPGRQIGQHVPRHWFQRLIARCGL